MGTMAAAAKMSDIRGIARQIAARFDPRKIVLSGSYAEGTPTPDSDIDLLVVMETRQEPLPAAAVISAAIDNPFPLGILVYRPSG